MAFWLLRRGWEIGVAEQKINQSSSAERAQALPACRYLMQWRYAPLREMLQREAGEVKTGIFYETKPTSLLESTERFSERGYKKCQKAPLIGGVIGGYSMAFRTVWQV